MGSTIFTANPLWIRAFVMLAAFTLVSCTTGAGHTPPEFTVETDRSDAEINTSTDGATTTVAVYSQSGIGCSRIKLLSGQWPEKLVLRFYLSGLEGMRFTYGDTVVTVSVNSSNVGSLQSVATMAESERPLNSDSAHWMPVQIVTEGGSAPSIPLSNGYFELQAPQDFLDGDFDSFTLQWVDFYR